MDQSSPGFILRHKKYTKLPEGAVLLSESDALGQQWNTVDAWTPQTEVWPIKYGSMVCGAAAALVGAFLTNFYRRKLKLVDAGLVSSYLPNSIFPGILNGALHFKFVSSDILLTKTACPLCVQVRSSVIQSVFGFIYPMALAPIVSFSFAEIYNTYPLPPIWKGHKELFRIWKKITRPAMPMLKSVLCVQVLLAIGVTYLEETSYHRMCAKVVDQAAWEELEPGRRIGAYSE